MSDEGARAGSDGVMTSEDETWPVMGPPPYITEGSRLRIRRRGQPDQYVVVDKVVPKGRGGFSLQVTSSSEDVDP